MGPMNKTNHILTLQCFNIQRWVPLGIDEGLFILAQDPFEKTHCMIHNDKSSKTGVWAESILQPQCRHNAVFDTFWFIAIEIVWVQLFPFQFSSLI